MDPLNSFSMERVFIAETDTSSLQTKTIEYGIGDKEGTDNSTSALFVDMDGSYSPFTSA